ncbi:MAG: alpha/beta fold hydrolase [Alphaproteobacteria bacterium]|nr:alpha/beta fold hydrolase [Alphaproteobacteria bacterium]
MVRAFILSVFLFAAALPAVAASYDAPAEGEYVVDRFVFQSGEELEGLRLHYRTIGALRHDADGKASNAVLVMHGTTGSGASLLRESFAGELFCAGCLLDARKYFIILPDGIGHGASSKPSDGLRMDFPQYDYDDMVKAQHLLLTEHLGVDRLRLVMGTSMGGMQSWMWAYKYPHFVDAAMPLASLPVEIAGRNRMTRQMIVDAIKADPAWNNGDYDPAESDFAGMRAAMHALVFMVSSPLQYQKAAPTRAEAEMMLEDMVNRYATALDPNDTIYAFEASRTYDPSSHLEKIVAPLTAINSADDQVNPPELRILESEIRKVAGGNAVVLPITDETRGHGTHSVASIWKHHLAALLEASER